MAAKLPEDIFAEYVSLGDGRSYAALAAKHGVDKKTIVRRAVAEDWQARLEAIQAKARAGVDERLAETIEDMNSRHLRTLRAIHARALEALKAMPLASAMEAIRAIDIAVRHERIIRGEPSERTATTVEDVVKREYRRWLVAEDEGPDDADGADPRAPATHRGPANAEHAP